MGLIASRLGRKPIQPLDFLECRDGWIFICCVEEHQWHEFVRMIGNPEWAALEIFADRLSRGANWDALKIFLQEWAREQCVAEVYQAAQHRRIPFAPVSTMGDLLASDHLKARGFFAELQLPGGAPITVPGAPYKLSATPWAIRRPAPTLRQHTEEMPAEAGVAGKDMAALRAAGDLKSSTLPGPRPALALMQLTGSTDWGPPPISGQSMHQEKGAARV
jgi:crotonobetainyl-CoA:carnitine CoA-transferase CaiB-like acyl-CoA transferase